jgi:predicted Zn-dependent protease
MRATEVNERGLSAWRQGDSQAALEFFAEARVLDPRDRKYSLSAANMFMRVGSAERAVPIYEEVLLSTRESMARSERYASMAFAKLAEARNDGCGEGDPAGSGGAGSGSTSEDRPRYAV